jgi:hypothetical protein
VAILFFVFWLAFLKRSLNRLQVACTEAQKSARKCEKVQKSARKHKQTQATASTHDQARAISTILIKKRIREHKCCELGGKLSSMG